MSDEIVTSKTESQAMGETEAPPSTIGGILRRLGPGLIVAASIVGSGELIATTATGAQAGFSLLWLVLIGCVIKVFVQVEFGRYSIVAGKPTMEGLSEVPGPRFSGRGNWLVWYWFAVFLASLAQQGGIVGGVGQAMAITTPLTEYGQKYNEYAQAETQLVVRHAELRLQTKLAGSDRRNVSEIEETKKLIFDLEVAANQTYLALLDDAATSETTTILDSLKTAYAAASSPSAEQLALVAELQPVAELAATVRSLRAQVAESPQDLDLSNKLNDAEKNLKEQRKSLDDLAEQLEQSQVIKPYFAARELERPVAPLDDKIWASIITVITIGVLYVGRYGLIQSFCTALVGSFTLITVANLGLLQSSESWSINWQEFVSGLKFRLPANNEAAIGTALATFGIIGVGASELIIYPYWCMEKGYARFTGPRDKTKEWAIRASGWLRVMRWDAWCSMIVYTFATIAFYLLGATILGRVGLDPKGPEMIRYLSVMYLPVFGRIAQSMFLFGAFAVLYSTFFVALASLSRVLSDALRVMGMAKEGEDNHRQRVKWLCVILPAFAVSAYWTGWDPRFLVLLSGLLQAIMLPMLAIAALFFRYKRMDDRVKPSKVWDIFLWTSAAGLMIAGLWALIDKLM